MCNSKLNPKRILNVDNTFLRKKSKKMSEKEAFIREQMKKLEEKLLNSLTSYT